MLASLKSATWDILAGSYLISGLPRIRHRGRAAILTYHRVVSGDMVERDHIQPGMYVLKETFDAHLTYLRRHFEIVSLDGLLDLWRTDSLKRDRAYCAITFDDGWRDNYQFAFPLLMKHGVPATIFLATDFIGTSRWFWPDQMMWLLAKTREQTTGEGDRKLVDMALAEAIGWGCEQGAGTHRESGWVIDPDAVIEMCKRLDPDTIQTLLDHLSRALHTELPARRVLLDWDEVREMAGKGLAFGSHSCSHRILTQILLAEVKQELADSKRRMCQEGITASPVFCYPNGNFNGEIQALAKESGYRAAVGCEIGLEGERPRDQFGLKRISLHEDSTASSALLAFTLSGLRGG